MNKSVGLIGGSKLKILSLAEYVTSVRPLSRSREEEGGSFLFRRCQLTSGSREVCQNFGYREVPTDLTKYIIKSVVFFEGIFSRGR